MNSRIVLATIVVSVLALGFGGVAQGEAVNMFPNPGFDKFDGILPTSWSAKIWNQPITKVKIHRLTPGRGGKGSCLEIEPGTPMTVMSLSSQIFPVSANQDYLFKGYYTSTCEGVTRDKKWMNAEGVTLSGNWLDADNKKVGSLTLDPGYGTALNIVLPDTQDRWVEFFQEIRSPENAQALQIVLDRRWIGGRLRFDDFSLREGKIRDYEEEFAIPQVPDEEFFPVFAWLAPSDTTHQDPEAKFDSDYHHAQYALANFNVNVEMNRPTGFGVKHIGSVVKEDAELAALGKEPLLWWFSGMDEPSENKFPRLAEMNKRVKRLAPSKPFWVNLLPTYGFESLEEYDHHIKAYIDIVKPKMLTYDHYCLVGNDPQVHADSWYSPNREGDYFANLEIVRKRALEADIEFGVMVSVGTFSGVRGASDAELRWQAFTTLAYGARSLGWFCYMTETTYGNSQNWEDHVVNRDGTRTRHYSMLKYLNGEVLAWGPTLLQLESTGVYHTDPLAPMTHPIKESRLVESIEGGMCLVGEFKGQDGRSYLMVVNRDFIKPVKVRLKFRESPEKLLQVSKQTGNKQAASGYSLEEWKLSIELGAGDAKLFCLK